MSYYLCVALGFYLGAAVINHKSFKYSSLKSIILGMLGALIFPITALIIVIDEEEL